MVYYTSVTWSIIQQCDWNGAYENGKYINTFHIVKRIIFRQIYYTQ